MIAQRPSVVFVPALLCDEAMYRDVIHALGAAIDAHVMVSPHPSLDDSAADILSRAPASFALVGMARRVGARASSHAGAAGGLHRPLHEAL